MGNLRSYIGHLTNKGRKRKGNYAVPNGVEPAGGYPFPHTHWNTISTPHTIITPPPFSHSSGITTTSPEIDGWMDSVTFCHASES